MPVIRTIMAFPPIDRFVAEHREVIDRLYDQSGAVRWTLDRSAFAEALHRSAAARFRGATECHARQVSAYIESLHIEDFALACACAAGSSIAWDHFVATVRPDLYAAAR